MSTNNWAPSEVAVYDQYMASAGNDVGCLAETLRALMAKRGDTQGVADMTAYVLKMPPPEVTLLLVAALKRLADTGEAGQ